MAVEAARLALARHATACPRSCCSRTTVPAYADKTNATAIHAALRLPDDDARRSTSGLSARSAVGALLLGARRGRRPALVVSADVRTGLPGSGRRGGAVATPPPRSWSATTPTGPVVAELVGRRASPTSSSTAGARPGELRTKVWDERFSEITYVPLGVQAWNAALEAAGLAAGDVAARRRRRAGAAGRRARSAGSSTACR